MPNHIHGIIENDRGKTNHIHEIIGKNPTVGAIHESLLQRIVNLALYRKHRRKMLIPTLLVGIK